MPGKRQSNSFVLTAKPKDGVSPESYSLVPSRTEVEFHSNGNGAAFTPSSIDVTVSFSRTVGGTTSGGAWPSPHGQMSIDGVTHYFVWRKYDSNGDIVSTFSGNQLLGWDRSYANSDDPTELTNDMGDGLVRLHGGIRVKSSCAYSAIEFAIAKEYPSLITSEADIIARVTIPVRKVSDGNTEPNYFPCGKYSDDEVYVKEGRHTPLVFMEDESVWNEYAQAYGEYWFLTADTNVVNGVHYAPQNGSLYWAKAHNYGVVIAGAQFTRFAKNGAGIMAGNYYYSANGSIDGEERVDGMGIDGSEVSASNPPAYTRFVGDPSLQKGSLAGSGTGTARVVLASFRMLKGMSLSFSFYGFTSSGTARVGLYRSKVSSVLASTTVSTSTGATLRTVEYTAVKSDVFTIEVAMVSGTSYTTANWEIDSGTWQLAGFFTPNWFQDLLTGKTWGAKGNFIVESTGGLKSKGADIEGTVRASNLFRTLAVAVSAVYSNSAYYAHPLVYSPAGTDLFYQVEGLTGLSSAEAANFKIGDIVSLADFQSLAPDYWEDWSSVPSGLLPCTGFADIIEVINRTANEWKLRLPDCRTVKGKLIEVHNIHSSGSLYVMQTVAGSRFNYIGTPDGNPDSGETIVAGGQGSFYSTGDKWLFIYNPNA